MIRPAILAIVLAATTLGAQSAKTPPKKPAPQPKCAEGSGGSNGVQSFVCRDGTLVDVTAEMWAETAKENKHRADLIFAMRSRLLTAAEEAEVVRYDWRLMDVQHNGGEMFYQPPDYEAQLMREFNDLLLQQFKLKQILMATAPCATAVPIGGDK